MKKLLKRILGVLHISVTRNQKYDAYTLKIIQRTLKPDSNCIDIGCHKGEILDIMIKGAPKGKKFGFEPIPVLYQFLSSKYQGDPTVKISQVALYDKTGTITVPEYTTAEPREYTAAEPYIPITIPLRITSCTSLQKT